METVECQVQKNLVGFCKILPGHVALWKSVLQDSSKPVQNVGNLCEQWRHVKNAKLRYLADFDDLKSSLLYLISTRIEEELLLLKENIDRLSKANNELKNKLLVFERSTLDLDWERQSELIRGNGTQPPLERLLQDGLSFLSFFVKSARKIGEGFKRLRFEDEKSVGDLAGAFNVDVLDANVTKLINLTQYVDNSKAVL